MANSVSSGYRFPGGGVGASLASAHANS
jgi:hypothetical protein